MTLRRSLAASAIALWPQVASARAVLAAASPRRMPRADNVDLRALNALPPRTPKNRRGGARLLPTPLPEAAAADTRIRVRVPPTGMWAQDNFITLWRAGDGWHVARQDKNYRAPPPPPPPPRPAADPAEWTPPPQPPPPNDGIHEGPIGAERSAQLDALLADLALRLSPIATPGRSAVARARLGVPDLVLGAEIISATARRLVSSPARTAR